MTAATLTQHWTNSAGCLDAPEDLHFPVGGERDKPRRGAALAQQRQAKAFCWTQCSVRAECLAAALERPADHEYGIYGGLTEHERRKRLPRTRMSAERAAHLKSLAAERVKDTHCSQGHPFAGDNLYVDTRGNRVCKTCRRANHARQRAARTARKQRYRDAAKAARQQVSA